jgi:hypothetical protein
MQNCKKKTRSRSKKGEHSHVETNTRIEASNSLGQNSRKCILCSSQNCWQTCLVAERGQFDDRVNLNKEQNPMPSCVHGNELKVMLHTPQRSCNKNAWEWQHKINLSQLELFWQQGNGYMQTQRSPSIRWLLRRLWSTAPSGGDDGVLFGNGCGSRLT